MAINFKDKSYLGMSEFIDGLIRKMSEPMDVPEYAAGNEKAGILELEKEIRANPGKIRRDRSIIMQKIIKEFGEVSYALYSKWPELYSSAYTATNQLKMPSPVLFVYNQKNEKDFNVAAYGVLDKLWIFFSIDLIESRVLTTNEYKFIIGHELGHVKFSHSMIGGTLKDKRLHEYTSDRVGIIASDDLKAGMSSLAKVHNNSYEQYLGRGKDELIRSLLVSDKNIEELLQCKIEDVPAVSQRMLDQLPAQFASQEKEDGHPNVYRRFAAMRLFYESEWYYRASGKEIDHKLLDAATISSYMEKIVI